MDKRNPKHSTTLQMLLDLETECINQNANVELSAVKQLITLVKQNSRLTNATDERFKKHKYPDSKMSFYKNYNAWCMNKKYQAIDISHLSHDARALLELFKDNMNQYNLVAISTKAIKSNGYRAGRSYTVAINELLEKGCITIVYKHNKNSPTVYAVSSRLGHYDDFSNRDLFVIGHETDEFGTEGPGYTELDKYKISVPRYTKKQFSIDDVIYEYNMIIAEEEL